MLIRIESDEDITKLLKKHKKYRQEYALNVFCQGYEYLVLREFGPAIFELAIAQQALIIAANGLRQAGLLGNTKHLNK